MRAFPADHVVDESARGAANLLTRCVGAKRGESLLLVVEPAGSTYYDAAVAPMIAAEATRLGAELRVLEAAPAAGPESIPGSLLEAIAAADHTVFLSRIGDQLRFIELPGTGSKSMVYTLGGEHLSGGFAAARHDIMEQIRSALMERIAESRTYSLSCPKGTELEMRIDGDELSLLRTASGFTIRNFPVMIIPPIPASGMNGRLVLSHALTSTGIHEYPDSVVPLASPVTLTLESGHILAVDGEATVVERVLAQMERVDRIFSGKGRRVGSWHAGINPFTFFAGRALDDIDRWNGIAFGSPRYAHFHLCGALPGDICGQVFDPTIRFDDEPLWQDGLLTALRTPRLAELAAQLGVTADSLFSRREIGVPL
jgi:hypothetical protein